MNNVRIVHWSVESFVPAPATGRKPPPLSATVCVASRALRTVLVATRPNHIAVEQMSVRARQTQQRLAYGILGAVSAVAAELSACPEGAVTCTAGFIAPSTKSRMMSAPNVSVSGNMTYQQRKAASIEAVDRLLRENGDDNWRLWFDALPKKDDASDALLLALVALGRRDDDAHRVAAIDVGERHCGVCVVEARRVPKRATTEYDGAPIVCRRRRPLRSCVAP